MHVDYVLAIGMFLITFAFVVAYTTDYYSTVKETASSMEKRSEAISLLSMAENGNEPENWPELTSNGTVLLMHLNNNTLDYSGIGNNGTISGANCSSSVTGRFFSSCRFNGVNDYVNVPYAGSLNLTNFTVSLWLSITANQGTGRIISQTEASNFRWLLDINNGLPEMRMMECGSSERGDAVATTNITGGGWHHIAAAYQTSPETVIVYIDGVPEENSTSFAGGAQCLSSAAIRIGSNHQSGLDVNGTIDEVAIFNRTLSSAEIRDLYRQPLRRIGLHSHAYRFYIKVNNSVEYRITPAVNDTDIGNELVSFNLTEIFGAADRFSIAIYDENETTIPYYINDTNITFAANVSINAIRWYTVYFDDDSIFPDLSTPVSGINNLTETITGYERIGVLQYEKIRQLNNSDYNSVKNASGIESSFSVQVYDTLTNATFEEFGGSPPSRGDIIALERFATFQNSTAGVRQGKIIVKVW